MEDAQEDPVLGGYLEPGEASITLQKGGAWELSKEMHGAGVEERSCSWNKRPVGEPGLQVGGPATGLWQGSAQPPAERCPHKNIGQKGQHCCGRGWVRRLSGSFSQAWLQSPQKTAPWCLQGVDLQREQIPCIERARAGVEQEVVLPLQLEGCQDESRGLLLTALALQHTGILHRTGQRADYESKMYRTSAPGIFTEPLLWLSSWLMIHRGNVFKNCGPIYMDPSVHFCLVTRVPLSRPALYVCGAQAKHAKGGLPT